MEKICGWVRIYRMTKYKGRHKCHLRKLKDSKWNLEHTKIKGLSIVFSKTPYYISHYLDQSQVWGVERLEILLAQSWA